MSFFAQLHLPTLLFVLMAVIFMLVGTHIIIFASYPDIPGVRLSAFGNFLVASPLLGLFLFSPDLLPSFSIFLNILMTSGFLLIYLGIREYAGKGVKNGKHLFLTMAVFSGTFTLLVTLLPWAFRTVAGIFVLGIICFLTAWEACDGFRGKSPVRWIFAGVFFLHGLFLLGFARGGMMLALAGQGALGQNPAILRITVIECIFAALAVNFTYILLITDLLSMRLKKKADTDYLTGTYNRRGIIQLGEATGRTPLSIIIADLDHFKNLNDTYGHAAGDHVLKEFTHTLGKGLRPWDILGRFGGEEFLILLPQLGGDTAFRVAERLCREVEKTEMPWEGKSVRYTVSMGVSSRDEMTDKDLNRLIAEADKALYMAKKSGRNKVVRFDPQPGESLQNRQEAFRANTAEI
ncbi:MAG: GGDEF domain-containing protein [Thermovirgaceae bacterium]